MSAIAQASASRARTQSRKKANDDASYFGPSTSMSGVGAKRQAAEKPDGEPRNKRKRAEPVAQSTSKNAVIEAESRLSLVEFNKLSTESLYRYMTQFDIIPPIYPSPLSAEDPPPPALLADPHSAASRPPSPPPPAATPANRPRRESREQSQRRRSSRLLDEELPYRTPVLAEVSELHNVLATIVEKHFRESITINGREEVDTLASFMCAVEKGKSNRQKY